MKKLLVFISLIFFSSRLFCQETPVLDNEKVLDYIQTQRFGEAAAYIKSVYPGEINDNKITARLGYLYFMSGNLPEAEKTYSSLLQKDSLNISLLLNMAAIYNRRENYNASFEYYKKVISIDSTIFSVYKYIASIADILRDSNKVDYLKRANKLNSIDGDVAYDLSNIYMITHRYAEADSVLKIASNADTSNLVLYRARAKLYNMRGQYREVIKLCEKLLAKRDSSGIVLGWLGSAYFQLNQYQKSINTFELLEKRDPITDYYMYLLGKSYAILKNEKKAIEYFDKAIDKSIEISPTINLYYYEKGFTYTGLQLPEKALSSYLKGLEYDSTNGYAALSLYGIALLYDKELKNKTNAIKYFQKFIDTVSEDGKVKPRYLSTLRNHFTYSVTRLQQLKLNASSND